MPAAPTVLRSPPPLLGNRGARAEMLEFNLLNFEMVTVCPAPHQIWKVAGVTRQQQLARQRQRQRQQRRLLMGTQHEALFSLEAAEASPAPGGTDPTPTPFGEGHREWHMPTPTPFGEGHREFHDHSNKDGKKVISWDATEEVVAFDAATGLILTGGGGATPALFMHDPHNCTSEDAAEFLDDDERDESEKHDTIDDDDEKAVRPKETKWRPVAAALPLEEVTRRAEGSNPGPEH